VAWYTSLSSGKPHMEKASSMWCLLSSWAHTSTTALWTILASDVVKPDRQKSSSGGDGQLNGNASNVMFVEDHMR